MFIEIVTTKFIKNLRYPVKTNGQQAILF